MQGKNNKIKEADKIAVKSQLVGLRTYQKDIEVAQNKDGDNLNTTEQKRDKKLKIPAIPIPPSTASPIKKPAPLKKSSTIEDEVLKAELMREEIKAEKERKRKEAEDKIITEKENEEKKRIEEIEQEKQTLEEIAIITEKENELTNKIQKLTEEGGILQQQKENLLVEKIKIEEALRPIVEKERIVEQKVAEIEKEEEMEKIAEKRRVIEQKRWAEEEERRKLEKEKWGIEKEAEKILITIEEKMGGLKDNAQQKEKISIEMKSLGKEKMGKELAQQLRKLSKIKGVFEIEWIRLNEKKKALEGTLTPVVGKENELNVQKRTVEEKERTAVSTQDRRKIEQERWGIEEERKNIEEKRWGFEREIGEIAKEIETLKPKYQNALAQEEEVQTKLAELAQNSTSSNTSQ